MGLGNPPDANQECSGDEQKEQEEFQAALPIQEELGNTCSDRNRR
jgi:hypothetical protein